MNKLNRQILLTAVLLLSASGALAQTEAERVTARFGDCLAEWCQKGPDYDDVCREQIEPLVDGVEKCPVDNDLMRLFVNRDTEGLFAKGGGTQSLDSYLNGFSQAMENGLTISHGEPMQQHRTLSPQSDSNDPLKFVSMTMTVKGDVNLTFTDLYFVRNGKIVKIINYDNNFIKAFNLYYEKRYNEAFSLFRAIAYTQPDNFDAQYYTTLMELKKQGCGFLGDKAREMEITWWAYRGLVAANMGKSNYYIWQLCDLIKRHGLSSSQLPYNASFMKKIYNCKPFSLGMMRIRNKDAKIGFMDERGQMAVPFRYAEAETFRDNGLAKVGILMPGTYGRYLYGFVNRHGEEVVAPKYLSAVDEFYDGHTFVIDADNRLLLIDEHGSVVKVAGQGYDEVFKIFIEGHAIAHKEGLSSWDIFDSNGNKKSFLREKPAGDYSWH